LHGSSNETNYLKKKHVHVSYTKYVKQIFIEHTSPSKLFMVSTISTHIVFFCSRLNHTLSTVVSMKIMT